MLVLQQAYESTVSTKALHPIDGPWSITNRDASEPDKQVQIVSRARIPALDKYSWLGSYTFTPLPVKVARGFVSLDKSDFQHIVYSYEVPLVQTGPNWITFDYDGTLENTGMGSLLFDYTKTWELTLEPSESINVIGNWLVNRIQTNANDARLIAYVACYVKNLIKPLNIKLGVRIAGPKSIEQVLRGEFRVSMFAASVEAVPPVALASFEWIEDETT